MKTPPTHLPTIESLNQLIGQPNKHPFITTFDFAKIGHSSWIDLSLTSDFYSIWIKQLHVSRLKYGQGYYDFGKGSLFFISPQQGITLQRSDPDEQLEGIGICFHPDLFKGTALAKDIHRYSFFSYKANEALHLSNHERDTLNGIVANIQKELDAPTDSQSQLIFVANLQLFLSYSLRYYERQFNTHKVMHKDLMQQFHHFLADYLNSPQLTEKGMPSVKLCARMLNVSASYLTDVLKKESGKNTQEHIHDSLIALAQDQLLNSQQTATEIAYNLGFEYPQYFSRFFKKKTGLTPLEFRTQT